MSDAMTDRYGLPFLIAGQAQKELTHNEALALIDILLHPMAQSAALSQPPEASVAGQCWIVASAGAGDWAGKDGCLACWIAAGWRFVPPRPAMRVMVADDWVTYIYDGESWVPDMARGDGYYIAGQRVVGARQDAIPDPAGGDSVDAEARMAIARILSAVRAHGLIEAG